MTARISIDGNLVADPDFGVGDSGKSWAHLRVASHERMRRDGEWVSTDPEFYNVTLFGAAAETAANELNKGDRVSIEGRPQLETFDRRDGTAGAAIKVYARKVLKVDDSAGADRSAADRDVSGEPVVRIDDPDNPLGPPAYEGPASAAHTRLTPGIYTAATFGDGITTFEATEAAPIRVRVTGTASYIATDPAAMSPGPDTAGASPRIHHTAEGTAVVGVGRTAAALHKTLKDNGFRWSTATTSWNLPRDMDEHTRAARVSELLSTVRANGRDLPVLNEPAPQAVTKGAASPATAGAPPAATVTTLRQPAGRSL